MDQQEPIEFNFSSTCCTSVELIFGATQPYNEHDEFLERSRVEETEDRVYKFEIVHENGLDYGPHMMVNGKPVYR